MNAQQPEYWYNTRTGEVEEGKQSIATELVGPFATQAEAVLGVLGSGAGVLWGVSPGLVRTATACVE